MSGYVSSWIESYQPIENPCIATSSSPLSSECIFWLIAGLIIGGLTFSKKGKKV